MEEQVQKKHSVITKRREDEINFHAKAQAVDRPKSGGEKTSTHHLASGSGGNKVGGNTDRNRNGDIAEEPGALQEEAVLGHLPFEKEVDFHHKIAYAFEKSFRLRENNKPEAVVKAANHEITLLISSQKWVLQRLDPLILFYCLYFSVFYENHESLAFLEDLISKLGFSQSHMRLNTAAFSQALSSKNGSFRALKE